MKNMLSGLRGNAAILSAGLILFLLFAFSLVGVRSPSQPVFAAVITPVAQTSRGGESARVAEFFDQRVITADTRVCFDLMDYETIDIQYKVDATDSNATTVSIQQTNIDPTTGPFNAANTLATVPATPADADVMTQVGLFGRWNCVFADVTDSDPLTLTVIGVAK